MDRKERKIDNLDFGNATLVRNNTSLMEWNQFIFLISHIRREHVQTNGSAKITLTHYISPSLCHYE